MMLKIFLYIPLLFLISSCNSTESGLRKNIRKFRECSIVVPNDMLALKGRKEINADEYINKIQPKLIIYYDSLSCNSCQVSHLFKLTALYELADSTEAFDVMTIFSQKAEEYDELMKELMIRNFYYPLFIDVDGSFRKLNQDIPEDTRFHSFLINEDSHPVFIGNPVENYDLWNLFNKKLKRYEKKKK